MKFYNGMRGGSRDLVRIHCPNNPTTAEILIGRTERWQQNEQAWVDAPRGVLDAIVGEYEQLPFNGAEATDTAIDATFGNT
jgi:hypothetical protein